MPTHFRYFFLHYHKAVRRRRHDPSPRPMCRGVLITWVQLKCLHNFEVSQKSKCRLKELCLLDGLMDGSQALRREVFGRNRNDDEVRREQRVPTALIQIGWAVDQDEIEAQPESAARVNAEKFAWEHSRRSMPEFGLPFYRPLKG